MSRKSLARLVVLCAALAGCADVGTNALLTAPAAHRSLGDAPADAGFATTIDGPSELALAEEPSLAGLAAAPMAAAARQAPSGGRASGHVGFTFAPPFLGLASERYSFTGIGTDAAPFSAKGEFEMMLTAATGTEQRFHGNVICMSTVGNVTRLAGQIEQVWINNVQRPITGATHVIWTVVDNGEGQGTTDTASPMFFNNALNAQRHCSVGFSPVQIPIQEGNIQVQP